MPNRVSCVFLFCMGSQTENHTLLFFGGGGRMRHLSAGSLVGWLAGWLSPHLARRLPSIGSGGWFKIWALGVVVLERFV